MSQIYFVQNAQDEDAEGLGAFNWEAINPIIAQGFDFGKTFLSAKYGKDAAKYQTQAAPPVVTTTAPPSAEDEAAIKAKADKSGFQLGDTFVPWSYVIIGGGLLFLLQSSGFQRRGR